MGRWARTSDPAASEAERAAAEEKVEAEVGQWTGQDSPVDADAVATLIDKDTQPT